MLMYCLHHVVVAIGFFNVYRFAPITSIVSASVKKRRINWW